MSKLSKLIILVIVINSHFLCGEAEDLFISEYIEGSAQNKALEIFNGTGESINLADYSIQQSHNGNGWGVESGDDYHLELVGILEDEDVLVIAADQADSEILGIADFVLEYSSIIHFNGNDAVGLFKNGVLIDAIGIEGETENWSVAGVSSATAEHTLVRKPEVESGVINWEVSAGTSPENSQWFVYAQDSFMFLGEHFMGTDLEAPDVTEIYPAWINTIEITFSEPVDLITAENADNYEINGVIVYTAQVQAGQQNLVILGVSNLEAAEYLLTINNVADESGNCIDDVTYSFEYINWEIVINEIHYNSATGQGSDDDFEFIELYNCNDYEVDLSGYQFVSGIEFSFPNGVLIDGGSFVLIARNSESYEYIDALLFQWDEGEQLTNSGETITLLDSSGKIVDRVRYLQGSGWPSGANGNGSTLELISPLSHNALPESWQASLIEGGTPGLANSTTGLANIELPKSEITLINYPNPFNPSGTGRTSSTTISFLLSTELYEQGEQMHIDIFNIRGQKIKTLSVTQDGVEGCSRAASSPFPGEESGLRMTQAGNTIAISWNGTNTNKNPVSSGIYFAILKLDNKILACRRMVLIK